jgi:hypothetical protein
MTLPPQPRPKKLPPDPELMGTEYRAFRAGEEYGLSQRSHLTALMTGFVLGLICGVVLTIGAWALLPWIFG